METPGFDGSFLAGIDDLVLLDRGALQGHVHQGDARVGAAADLGIGGKVGGYFGDVGYHPVVLDAMPNVGSVGVGFEVGRPFCQGYVNDGDRLGFCCCD